MTADNNEKQNNEPLTKVLAKAMLTEAVVQQLQHFLSVVGAGQATFGKLQIINFYF